MYRSRFFRLALPLCLLLILPSLGLSKMAKTMEPHPPLIVVELFSSQGCPKCPPANAFLAQLAKEKNILPLTWSVDFWDYLGWKDSLANKKFSKRQARYNHRLGKKGIYTPEIIIHGRKQMVGSHRKKIHAAIKMARSSTPTINLRLRREAEKIHLSLSESSLATPATIWLIRYDRMQKVHVSGGANANRHIRLIHPVRDARNLGEYAGKAMELTFPIRHEENKALTGDACAILVQEREMGPILAASTIDLRSSY